MSTEEVKDVFRHDLAELWNKGNLALADEIFTADVVLHGAPPELPPGVEGVKQVISMYRAAFPDFYVTDEDVIAEGDKIVSR
jgi:predicted ester cyclase